MPRLNRHAVETSLALDRQREDEEDERLAPDGDRWHVLRGRWENDGRGLAHDNFTCDMTLRLNGDFASPAQRQETLVWLEQRLNQQPFETSQAPAWSVGRWTSSPMEKSVFHRNPERDLGLRVSGDFGNPRLVAHVLTGLTHLLNGESLPK